MLHKAWNSKEEMPYCFPRSSIKFQGHTVQNITDFDPNWAFPDYRPVAAFKSLRFALFMADWEKFHDLCLEGVTEDILEELSPLHCFVKHITKATNDSIPRATTIPRNQTIGLMKNFRKPSKQGEPWTRESDKIENSEGKLYPL